MNATEASKATLLVLAFWHSVRNMSPQDQYQFYLNKKPTVTKLLASALVGGSHALPELPMSWRELPADLLAKTFPTGRPAELKDSIASEMVQLVRNYPLRKDNKLLFSQGIARPAQGVPSTDVVSVEAVCKVVEACSRLRSDSLRESGGPLAGSMGSQAVEKKPLLALEDGTVDGSGDLRDPARSQVEVCDAKTLTVQQQVAALKKGLPEEKRTPRRAPLQKAAVVAKRPAAKRKVAKAMSPKAKCSVPRKTTCLKRPAAQQQAGASSAMGREAKRQAILLQVPRALKQKFANGCAKCKHRSFCTPPCWAERGFTFWRLSLSGLKHLFGYRFCTASFLWISPGFPAGELHGAEGGEA